MKLAMGSDERTHLTDVMVAELEKCGHTLELVGPLRDEPMLWPHVALAVAERVARGAADEGVLLCWTGTGVSIAANKVPGIRAALCHESYTARMSREHNNANVLCIGARVVGMVLAAISLLERNPQPTEAEIRACSRWLEPQLAALAPKAILCVGGPSAKALIKPDFRITKERGKYFPCRYAKVALATLHPAYILRQQSSRHDGGYSLLVADIARAWSAAQRLRAQMSLDPAQDAPPQAVKLQGLLFDAASTGS